MKIIKIAKLLYHYINYTDIYSLYDGFTSDDYFNTFRSMISLEDYPKVVFLARKIGLKKDPEKLLPKLNNLFIFCDIEFGDNENYIECENCEGSGEERCFENDGRGYTICNQCGGDGVIECDECGGGGETFDGEGICDKCYGQGELSCDYCDGDGSNNCDECNGRGESMCSYCDGSGDVESSEYVPYVVNQYVSYNQNLRTSLEQSIIRNEEYFHESQDISDFLIYTETTHATGDYTDQIDHKFINESYVNGFADIDVVSLKGGKLYVYDLTLPADKFLS